MRDFRVELHAVEALVLVGDRGQRAGGIFGNHAETSRQIGDLVTVAHPDFEVTLAVRALAVLDTLEEATVAVRADFGVTELAHLARLDLATQNLCHPLHAVADAQHRNTQLEQLRIGLVVGFIHRVRAAGQDNARGLEFADEVDGDIKRMQLTLDVGFAHAPRDQLGDLRTEVQNQNLVHAGHFRRIVENPAFYRAMDIRASTAGETVGKAC